jgi:hypothetical protein
MVIAMTDREDVVAFRADSLSGPWSQPFMVAPLNTRTFNSQSGFSLRIKGTKKTTYLYIGDQVSLSLVRRMEGNEYSGIPTPSGKAGTSGFLWILMRTRKRSTLSGTTSMTSTCMSSTN